MFLKRRVYLDRAAGASANPSSPHAEGREAKHMLEEARTAIARLTEVQADDVIFTSGATEANALAILGIARSRRKAAGSSGIHVLYLPSAHASVVENMRLLAEEGVTVEPLPIKDFRVDTKRLAAMLRKETILVSMDAVCGETGVIWNTREVAETLKKSESGALLHVDASQAPLTEKTARSHFGADLLALDASKVGKVRGIGVLVAHRTISLVPLYEGGGQERGLRSGSESPELARQFAESLREAALNREAFRDASARMRAELIAAIIGVKDIHINEGRSQAPHILNISLPGRDTDYLVALLDEAGFAVSTRSACETDSQVGSRAVLALTSDPARARATLRISWGPAVSPHDLSRFSRELLRAVAFIDSSSRR